MTVALITLGVALLAALTALIAVTRMFLQREQQQEAAITSERRELLNRVQAPQLVPREPATSFNLPVLEPDAIDEVGMIQQLDDDAFAKHLEELS